MLAYAQRRRAAPPHIQTGHIPAPTGGLNKSSAGNTLPATECISLYNMVPSPHGLRVRTGYAQWVTGITGATGAQVRSILPFTGSTSGASKLFACSSNKIWDVSASTGSPSSSLTFSSSSGNAGYGVCAACVTSAGHFLLYADEVNGYHVYTEAGAWAEIASGVGATQVSGIDPGDAVFVMTHQNRVWMVERGTASGWYLDAGAIYGAAVEFNFGRQFRAGGYLVGLWSATLDGGAGPNDMLVAISSGGDVVVYQGTDPADASSWALIGTWQVGGVVGGRRIATTRGGDLLITSSLGLVALSTVMRGAQSVEQYETAKLGPYFNQLASTYGSLQDWGLYIHPGDNTLVLAVPSGSGQNTNQLAMSLSSRAWGQYSDLPMFSAAAWGRDFYFGSVDGVVYKQTGTVDNVLLSDSSYTPIEWKVLTQYSNLGSALNKRVEFIKPVFLTGQTVPLLTARPQYDYDLILPDAPSGSPTSTGPVWDSAIWDTDVWAGEYTASTQMFGGGNGMGKHVAIAARGKAVTESILVGFDVGYTQGGAL